MRARAFALGACLWLAAPTLAVAQTSDSSDALNVETAREEFRRASAAAQAERWAEAIELYRSAYRRVPRATTLYNIGFCREKLGDFAAAYRDTFAALEMSRRDSARGLASEQQIQAEEALVSLRVEVARVEFSANPEGAAVLVDGAPVAALGSDTERLFFVDATGSDPSPPLASGGTLILHPGHRRIEIRSARGTATVALDLRANTTTTFIWPTFEPARVTPPSPPEAAQKITAAPPAPPQPEAPPVRSLQPWAVGSFVMGGAALALGTGAGLVALTAKGDLDDACSRNGDCPARQSDTVSRFETSATLANVAFVVAAVSTAAGVTLLVLDSSRPASADLALRVTAAGRVELGGRF